MDFAAINYEYVSCIYVQN